MVLRRLTIGLGIVSALVILTGTAYSIWRMRADAFDRAELRVRDVATLLAEQSARAIAQADTILVETSTAVARHAGGAELSASARLHDILRTHAVLPQLRLLLMIGPSGQHLSSSDRDTPSQISYADRDYFSAQRKTRGPGLFIGAPIVGRVSGEPTIPLSRRVERPDGTLLGIIAAGLDLRYFDQLSAPLELGRGGGIQLLHRDGTLLGGHPIDAAARGTRARDASPLLEQLGSNESIVARESETGEPRLTAVRAVSRYPLAVAVSLGEGAILASWMREAWAAGLLGAFAAGFVLALTIALVRRMQADADLRADLREIDARWRFALEGAEHGVFDWNIAAGRFYRSEQYLAMVGYSAAELQSDGPSVEPCFHPDDRKRAARLWEDCRAGHRLQFSEEFRLVTKDGRALAVLLSGKVVEHDARGKPARLIGTVTDLSELKTAESRVRQGQERLDAIVRSAMDGIITIDRDRRIILFNAAAEKMFGYSAQQAIGAPLDNLVPERFRAQHHAHVERFARTGETSRRMGTGQQTALWGMRADGTEFPIEASISHVTVGDQQLLTVILRDITPRMNAEREIAASHAALRESRERLDAIIRSAMDAIITVGRDQRIVLFNAAAEKMFGCNAAQAVGAPLNDFIPERFRGAHHAHIERFGRTGATARRMGMQTALWARRADGTEFPIEASISHATVGGQQLFTVILRDITERTNAEAEIRRSQEQLRSLSVAMLEVREAERTRIARELHDELGQALTALKMDVDLLNSMMPPQAGELRERTAAMRELLDFTVATTRRISSDLRPLVLDDLGLGAAAEWLAQNFSQRTGVPCDLSVEPSCAALGEPYASTLFRIMQESLTNAARHARAQRVEVRLERSGGDAVLSIRDDGVGMESAAQAKPRSFGLRGIRERVLILGGTLSIVSHPGKGTTLLARIPINRAIREAA